MFTHDAMDVAVWFAVAIPTRFLIDAAALRLSGEPAWSLAMAPALGVTGIAAPPRLLPSTATASARTAVSWNGVPVVVEELAGGRDLGALVLHCLRHDIGVEDLTAKCVCGPVSCGGDCRR